MLEENKQLVRRYYEHAMGDLSGIEQIVASDFVDHHFPPGIPAGPEGVRKFFAEVLGGIFSDMRIDIDLPAGGRGSRRLPLHAARPAHGRIRGDRPARHAIRCPAISTFRIAGGKLAEAWEIFDSGDLLSRREDLCTSARMKKEKKKSRRKLTV